MADFQRSLGGIFMDRFDCFIFNRNSFSRLLFNINTFQKFSIKGGLNNFPPFWARIAANASLSRSKSQIRVSLILTLRRPLRRKLRMRWFFDVSKVKESSFFNRTSLIFDVHLLENTDLSPSRFHFSLGFISRSYFESDGLQALNYSLFKRMRLKRKITMLTHTNKLLIT